MTKTKTWTPILDMDDETTGEHTCYFRETNDPEHPYIWLNHFPGGWHVETGRLSTLEVSTVAICKTLTSAKRWVTANPWAFDFS